MFGAEEAREGVRAGSCPGEQAREGAVSGRLVEQHTRQHAKDRQERRGREAARGLSNHRLKPRPFSHLSAGGNGRQGAGATREE